MIKIDLITGFLGAGKTTFLKKYARYLLNQGQNIGILENDFGAVNVAQQETMPQKAKKLPKEAMSQDVQMFMGRFQELRRKMGGMQSQQLKDAVCRELPDGTGVQVILGRELPVDEQALGADLEALVERELNVHMKFQVHTPHNDPRPQEPVADLSGLIDMEIEIDAE